MKPSAYCKKNKLLVPGAAKQQLFEELEKVVASEVPIGSDTSAIPISIMQKPRAQPRRFLGMHWSEPAHDSRFLELIAGSQTSEAAMAAAVEVARRCGKDPSIQKKTYTASSPTA